MKPGGRAVGSCGEQDVLGKYTTALAAVGTPGWGGREATSEAVQPARGREVKALKSSKGGRDGEKWNDS